MDGQELNPTRLLRAWRDGDAAALDSLMSILYDELSRLARNALRGERANHTLQTRALVHEAYLRLIDADVDWQDRAHFLALAARAMRRILADYARARHRVKRGGNVDGLPLDIDNVAVASADPPNSPVDILDLDDALTRLEAQDERKARLVELHFYTGLSYEEAAEVLGISVATVGRELRIAKAWLGRELGVRPS